MERMRHREYFDSEPKWLELFYQSGLLEHQDMATFEWAAKQMERMNYATIIGNEDFGWKAKVVEGKRENGNCVITVSTMHVQAGKLSRGPLDDWDEAFETLICAFPKDCQPTLTFERAYADPLDPQELCAAYAAPDHTVAMVLLLHKVTEKPCEFGSEKLNALTDNLKLQILRSRTQTCSHCTSIIDSQPLMFVSHDIPSTNSL